MTSSPSPANADRSTLTGAARVAWQHVVGTFEVDWLGDGRPGGRISTASNRVRSVIERGLASLPQERAALARGLMIGDDRDQSVAAIERMRASGLAHLTAVSGQNVALVIAAASPLLRRARPLARWAVTLALIAWFVVLTRAEPSVLRAGTMAAIGATAFALGRQREPLRLLAVAVVGLLLVDPLLAWSVGFWLSVGATAGVTGVGPPLAARLDRWGRWRCRSPSPWEPRSVSPSPASSSSGGCPWSASSPTCWQCRWPAW